MFGTLSLIVLLAVQALLAHANPAVVEVELIKRTCVRRRSPGGLIKRNDCTTTLTTCPVTPTVTTTTTTITTTTKVIYVPTTTTTTTTEKETKTTTTTTTEKETKTTTTTTTTCPATTPPPGNCDLGTAFGLGDCCSTPLNAAPAICTRWGWYITGTTFPIKGTLWVGAGQNDVSKGTDVGDFVITKDGTSYTITYTLDSGFSATEVHIYAACSKPTTCAPGQFNLSTSPATITLDCPTVYFVLHAKVSGPRSADGTCPTPAT